MIFAPTAWGGTGTPSPRREGCLMDALAIEVVSRPRRRLSAGDRAKEGDERARL